MSSIWGLIVTAYHMAFNNPLYQLPNVSFVLALIMTVLCLSAVCTNAWRSLFALGWTEEETYRKRQDAGMNTLAYGIALMLYGLTAAFLYFHIAGSFAVVLGIVLVLYAWAVSSDSPDFDAIPFGDVLLIWFAGVNLAMHLWALNATHGWWLLLLPLLDSMQSFTLWCLEVMVAGAFIWGFVQVIRQVMPEMRHQVADGVRFLRDQL